MKCCVHKFSLARAMKDYMLSSLCNQLLLPMVLIQPFVPTQHAHFSLRVSSLLSSDIVLLCRVS